MSVASGGGVGAGAGVGVPLFSPLAPCRRAAEGHRMLTKSVMTARQSRRHGGKRSLAPLIPRVAHGEGSTAGGSRDVGMSRGFGWRPSAGRGVRHGRLTGR